MRERTDCRSCGAPTGLIMSFGEPSLSTFLLPGEEPQRAPLDLRMCRDCSLVQLGHVYPGDWFYRWYGYRSGTNGMMVEALDDLAREVTLRAPLIGGDSVLDIGSNDGTFLRALTRGVKRVGIDPAQNLGDEARKNLDLFVNGFFSAEALAGWIAKHGRFKAVTATAMFYHLEDPIGFLQDVAKVIDDDGLLVIQMNYLGAMLRENGYDNVVHEHQTYFSLGTLLPILGSGGFRAIDVSENAVNGGSFRVLCRPIEAPEMHREGRRNIELMLARESELGMEVPRTYSRFADRVRQSRMDLRTLIAREQELRRSVYVYGASTRGLAIMDFCGLTHEWIDGAAERNSDKWGRTYGGTGIPCVPEDEARAKAKSFLILPHHFLGSFVEREAAWLAAGGRFIVPLPRVRVLTAGGVEEEVIA